LWELLEVVEEGDQPLGVTRRVDSSELTKRDAVWSPGTWAGAHYAPTSFESSRQEF
jgi:hypothetical protein